MNFLILGCVLALAHEPGTSISTFDGAAPRDLTLLEPTPRWTEALAEQEAVLDACGQGRITVHLIGRAGALVGVEIVEPGSRDPGCVVKALRAAKWPPFPDDGAFRVGWGERSDHGARAGRLDVSDCVVEALHDEVSGRVTLRWHLDRGTPETVEVVEDAAYHPPLTTCLREHGEDWRFDPELQTVTRPLGLPRVQDDALGAYMKERRPTLHACVETHADGRLAGRLDVLMKIEDQRLAVMRPYGLDPDAPRVVECYLQELATWTFPEGPDTWLTYSFVLDPSGIQVYDADPDRDYAIRTEEAMGREAIEASVERLWAERRGWFDACLEEHRARRPELAGRWALSCAVRTSGELDDCTAKPLLSEDAPFEGCLVEKAERMKIDGRIDTVHRVERLFTFAPEGEDE